MLISIDNGCGDECLEHMHSSSYANVWYQIYVGLEIQSAF